MTLNLAQKQQCQPPVTTSVQYKFASQKHTVAYYNDRSISIVWSVTSPERIFCSEPSIPF